MASRPHLLFIMEFTFLAPLLVFRSMSVHSYMLAWEPRAVVFKLIPSMDHIFTSPDIKHIKHQAGREPSGAGTGMFKHWLDLGQHRFRGRPLCRKISFLLSEYRTSRVRLRCWHPCEQGQQPRLLQCQSLPATPVSHVRAPHLLRILGVLISWVTIPCSAASFFASTWPTVRRD